MTGATFTLEPPDADWAHYRAHPELVAVLAAHGLPAEYARMPENDWRIPGFPPYAECGPSELLRRAAVIRTINREWDATMYRRCGIDPDRVTPAPEHLRDDGDRELTARRPYGNPRAAQAPATLSAREQKAVIAAYVERGESAPTIAIAFGVSKDLIYNTLDRAGVARRPKWQRKREMSQANRARVLALQAEGNGSRAIAEATGIYLTTVRRYLADAGRSRRTRRAA